MTDADFFAIPTSGNTPLDVVFSDNSTSTDPITGWYWTFGDGHTSTSQNPVYTYTHQGTYTVTLTVTTAFETDTETKILYIAVTSAPIVLKTLDVATPAYISLLRNMTATGDGKQSTLLKGIRYYKANDADTNGSGFKRPSGPLLTFD